MEAWEAILWCIIVPIIAWYWGRHHGAEEIKNGIRNDKERRQKQQRQYYASPAYLNNEAQLDKAIGFWRGAVKNYRDNKLDGYYKDEHTVDKIAEAIGLSVMEFNEHLMKTYHDRYGKVPWNSGVSLHIDHIVPLAIASTPAEVIALSHYSNLQLLQATHNLEKGSTLGVIDDSNMSIEIQNLLRKKLG